MNITIDGKTIEVEAWLDGAPHWISLKAGGQYVFRDHSTAPLRALGAMLIAEADKIDAKIAQRIRSRGY